MSTSANSHGKKSNKETQSSLIRIFKEIIMRENNDSEKRNLLTSHQQQKEDRKRIQHISRSKIERKSNASTSSEHRKRSPRKVSSIEQSHAGVLEENQYGKERKESWTDWGLKDQQKSSQDNQDETCSCVSCALRRIVDSEYACVICLLLIFIISIGAACFMVFRTVPLVATESTDSPSTKVYRRFKTVDSERLKRKIDLINENGMKNKLGEGVFGKIHYDDIRPDTLDLPSSSDIDFETNFQDLTDLEDGDNTNSDDMELATFLQPEKLDVQGNDKLREFYKKLVETDAKIKELKKYNSPESNLYNIAFGTKSPDRSRRSLKLYHYPKKRYDLIRRRRDLYDKRNTKHQLSKQRRRPKRFKEDTDKPTGFVIENKKFIIQYQPADKRKVPKCSHTPKESNAHHHEHEQKHPFYQNSQRLDELLDRFFNKNLPELMVDPFGLDALFQQHKNKCKHPKHGDNNDKINSKQVTKSKEESKVNGIGNTNKNSENFQVINNFRPTQVEAPRPFSKLNQVDNVTNTLINKLLDLTKMGLESTTVTGHKNHNDEAEMFDNDKQESVTVTANDFEVLLSISTIMNREISRTGKPITDIPLIDKVPNIRRLMQADGEEEDNLGYEDFKEVLTDDMENQDDLDRRADRNKREKEAGTVTDPTINNEEQIRLVPILKETKLNAPGVHNPNWKGPMPLYPDELSSMIRHDINANKVCDVQSQPPSKTKIDVQDQNNIRRRKHISDVEYVEDYLDNRYSKLVEMAQAYSDYGVLEGKKENTKNEKNQATDNISADHRVKLSIDGNFQRRGLFGRMKESSVAPFINSFKGNNFINLMNEQNAAVAKTISHLPSCHASEGIRIEIRPTTGPRDDDIQISKVLKSHFKINNDKEVINVAKTSHAHTAHTISTYPDVEFLYSPKMNLTPIFEPIKKKILTNNDQNDYTSDGLIFAINKGRALLSTQTKKYDYDSILREVEDIFGTNSDNEDSDRIFEDFLPDDNAKRISEYNMEKQTNPDLIERILTKYSDTEKNNLPYRDNNKMHILNTQNVHKKLADKTNSPLNKNVNSGTMLFKTTSNINGISKEESDKIINFNPDEILITIARSEIKPKLLDKTKSEGQILITCQNSELGLQNIELTFDSPVTNNVSSLDQAPHDSYNTHFSGTVMLTTKGFQENASNLLDFSKHNHKVSKRFKRNTVIRDQLPVKINGNNHSVFSVNTVSELVPANETENILNANLSSKYNAVNNNNTRDKDIITESTNGLKPMDGIKMDRNRSHETIGSEIIDRLLNYNNNFNKSNEETANITATHAHDSEMQNNIIHRSRVLLSIKDSNITDGGKSDIESIEVKGVNSTNVSGDASDTISTTISPTSLAVNRRSNSTLIEHEYTTVANFPIKYRGVKTKVKRNADDSNLIFWSDIYDDEYGIKTDNLDNIIRDKYFNKQSEFIKKSGRWVQEKFKKLAENLKSTSDSQVVARKRTPRAMRSVGIAQYPKYILDKILKRDSALEIDNNKDEKSVFHSLGAHMVEVCKKTADAVKQTRNIEVKENSKQGTMATSLMQQLVGLLTELVDYQVQQKTCTKLPPDLQKFLEWLTLPEDREKPMQNSDLETLVSKTSQAYPTDDLMDSSDKGKNSDPNQDYDTTLPQNEKEGQKASYLDTMRSVQDLLEQYELMNDEDKSKMTGVNYYLQNQMKFLRSVFGSNAYDTYDTTNLLRYKRNPSPRHPTISKRGNKRKLRKFIKNFGKKHTRTTASFYDGLSVTDMKKIQDERFGLRNEYDQKKSVTKFIKRNLKDVYFHAVAEAKKYTKTGYKKGELADFSTTQNAKIYSYFKN